MLLLDVKKKDQRRDLEQHDYLASSQSDGNCKVQVNIILPDRIWEGYKSVDKKQRGRCTLHGFQEVLIIN